MTSGMVPEFKHISLELSSGDELENGAEIYVWKRPDGAYTINAHVYGIHGSGSDAEVSEACMTVGDVRRVIAALSSAASFVENLP